MTIKETKLRIEPELDQWLTSQAVIAGIAKTKYIVQTLEAHRISNTHTHYLLSPNISPESPSDRDLAGRVAAIESRLAKVERNNSGAIPNAIPKDIPQFEVGQVITGQHSAKYALMFNSDVVVQKSSKEEYLLNNKVGVICKVDGGSRNNKKKLKVIATFPGDPVVLNSDGTFLKSNGQGQLEWFTESELAALAEPPLAEPTAPVESANDETSY